VISGLARGIDGEAHRAALTFGGRTFAVLGHGLTHLYPPEHDDLAREILAAGGALISQFMPTMQASRWTFPQRNEVMCAIAQGTVIIEIELDRKKGSLIQAEFSIKHGRPVFILGSNVDEIQSPDAARLLGQGDAIRVDSFADVLKVLRTSQLDFSPASVGAETQERRSLSAVLFDLDGVIYDPSPVMLKAYRTALTRAQVCAPEDVEIVPFLAHSPRKVLQRFGAAVSAEQYYRSAFSAHLSSVCAFEPVLAFIRELHEQGVKIGVVTSQPRSRCAAILERCGVAALMDVVVTWSDIPRGKTKPDPYSLLHAIEFLRLAPQDAVYVGDTPVDILTARNARMRSVAVGWGLGALGEMSRWSPDLVIPRVEDIGSILTRLPPAQQRR
jgi:HAD superfamily hydrolase (TIGR01509 family)